MIKPLNSCDRLSCSGGSVVFILGGHWGGDTFIWGGGTQLILSCWTAGYV